MRTKALLAAAAITAATIASSMAQSNVYSQNVVGYVNAIATANNFTLVANPLNNANNSLTNLIKTAPDGTSVFTWNAVAGDFDGLIPAYSTFFNAWSANVQLPPGKGFFILQGSSTTTNTFVGDVVQGPFTNSLLGGGSFNMIGSSAPLGGSFTNAIAGLVPADGDSVFKWDINAGDFNGTIPAYSTFFNAWSANVNIDVAEGLFYLRSGGNVNWVRNFTVQ